MTKGSALIRVTVNKLFVLIKCGHPISSKTNIFIIITQSDYS